MGVYSTFFFFFFFFFGGVGQGSCSAADMSKLLYQCPTPTREQTGSLELSLQSPAGIWFKTPLPVGGANTASQGSLPGAAFPKLQRPGVWGSPNSSFSMEYPLNLQGAACPTLARWSNPSDGEGCCTRPGCPYKCFMSPPSHPEYTPGGLSLPYSWEYPLEQASFCASGLLPLGREWLKEMTWRVEGVPDHFGLDGGVRKRSPFQSPSGKEGRGAASALVPIPGGVRLYRACRMLSSCW